MKTALICLLLAGCARAVRGKTETKPEATLILTDSLYQASPHSVPPVMLLDETELSRVPFFHVVGVLQLEDIETRRLAAFYEDVSAAGAAVGCDVLFQRDAFALGARVPTMQLNTNADTLPASAVPGPPNGEWRPNGRVLWQFFCGVTGAGEGEQERTMDEATEVAIELRRKVLDHEPCDPYIPTGSHVRHDDLCGPHASLISSKAAGK
ncbi:MAG TPA: hypothetical protein VH083_26665 [Myxococcales bacterium]|jgi:hypothetical protein|nr:hypothetical protein [Myxococcales bacterium]